MRRQRRGAAEKVAAAVDDGGTDGTFFCTVFVAFHYCFDTILTVKWCRFGDKTGTIFGAKRCCFEYCLAIVFGASC